MDVPATFLTDHKTFPLKNARQYSVLQENTLFRIHPANPGRASIPLSETHYHPANPVHETPTPTIFINNGGQETGIILLCLLLIIKYLVYGFRLAHKVPLHIYLLYV